MAYTADFKITRLVGSVTTTGHFAFGYTAGADYNLTATATQSNTFCRLTSGYNSGLPENLSSLDPKDYTFTIENHDTFIADGQILLGHRSAKVGFYGKWVLEIIEYIGGVGGPNEIEVYQYGTFQNNGSTLFETITPPAYMIDKCMPIVTSVEAVDATGIDDYLRQAVYCKRNGANLEYHQPSIWYGEATYLALYFKGSNWGNVGYAEFVNLGATSVALTGVVDNGRLFTTYSARTTDHQSSYDAFELGGDLYFNGGNIVFEPNTHQLKLYVSYIENTSADGTGNDFYNYIDYIQEPSQQSDPYTLNRNIELPSYILDRLADRDTSEISFETMLECTKEGGGAGKFPQGQAIVTIDETLDYSIDTNLEYNGLFLDGGGEPFGIRFHMYIWGRSDKVVTTLYETELSAYYAQNKEVIIYSTILSANYYQHSEAITAILSAFYNQGVAIPTGLLKGVYFQHAIARTTRKKAKYKLNYFPPIKIEDIVVGVKYICTITHSTFGSFVVPVQNIQIINRLSINKINILKTMTVYIPTPDIYGDELNEKLNENSTVKIERITESLDGSNIIEIINELQYSSHLISQGFKNKTITLLSNGQTVKPSLDTYQLKEIISAEIKSDNNAEFKTAMQKDFIAGMAVLFDGVFYETKQVTYNIGNDISEMIISN